MADQTLPRSIAVIAEGMSDGLHIGAQLYVSLHGRTISDLAFGEGRPGVAMSPDTLMPWRSAGKPITAVAIARLAEGGQVHFTDSVARHIPEFATHGKDAVTIEHLLTHTGGFRMPAVGAALEPWNAIIARICAGRLEPRWMPGQKAGYHLASSWFILGEIVKRVDGRAIEEYVRQEILLPCGMTDSWMAMAGEIYRGYGERMGIMHDTAVKPPAAEQWDDEAHVAAVRPGAGMRGPIRELGRFYEKLLLLAHGRDDLSGHSESPASGEQEPPPLGRGWRTGMSAPPTGMSAPPTGMSALPHRPPAASEMAGNCEPAAHSNPHAPPPMLSAKTIEAMTSRRRIGLFDHTFKHTMDWGLGFMVNSARYGEETVPYGFGPHASDQTFGHGGAQSSMGMADPENGLLVAFVFNGMPGEQRHHQRNRAMLTAIYEDLGLARA